MTLREFLNRRSRRASAVSAIAVAAVWALMIHLPTGSAKTRVMAWGFMGGILLCGFICSRTRCPRCGAGIGYIDPCEARSRRKWRREAGLNLCGKCGLHLDEQISPGAE